MIARGHGLTGYPPSVPPRPVILDCDPGHDDALAILLALARPELHVDLLVEVIARLP